MFNIGMENKPYEYTIKHDGIRAPYVTSYTSLSTWFWCHSLRLFPGSGASNILLKHVPYDHVRTTLAFPL